jgi:hypothetical protein
MAFRLNGFFTWFNRQNSMILIFILCMANFFSLYLEGGEEQYFGFARQFMDPTWMPNSFTLNHPAGGNLIFQVIVGFLLKYITFEQMAIWGRALNFLLYAIPLSLIFKKLRITNLEMIFLLQVIFFSHQALYAGEWIFKNLEEKSLAYIFVFWSVYYLLNDKAIFSGVFAAMATYFHFLVGGWMFCFVFLYFVFRSKKWPAAVTSGAVYLAVTLPFILYLYHTYMTGNPAVINGVNTNAIYAFWRLKHHIGIFHDFHYFFTYAFWGVLLTLILFVICLLRFSRFRHPAIRQLNSLNIIIFSQQIVSMVIAIFDTHGVFVKTYPFRTNSLSFLIFLMELFLVLKIWLANTAYRKAVLQFWTDRTVALRKVLFSNTANGILLVISITVLFFESAETFKKLDITGDDLDMPMVDLIRYSKENTPGSSVFLFLDGDRPYSFIRRAERERFVVVKFTPTRSTTIYEWYNRALLKENLRKDIALIDSIKTAYQVDYLVTDSSYTHSSLVLEKQFGTHRLYKITR